MYRGGNGCVNKSGAAVKGFLPDGGNAGGYGNGGKGCITVESAVSNGCYRDPVNGIRNGQLCAGGTAADDLCGSILADRVVIGIIAGGIASIEDIDIRLSVVIACRRLVDIQSAGRGEGVGSDCFNGSRNCDLRQFGAAGKRVFADVGHRAWEGNGFQHIASAKRISADAA